jgi:hypothetical protein
MTHSSITAPLAPEILRDRAEAAFSVFYRTPRAGQVRLSDGGGPFGFDIGKALIVDYLVAAYGCDAVAETGCFLGDTTWFLGSCYPDLPVLACDIDPQAVSFTRSRTTPLPNVGVSCRDAVDLVSEVTAAFARPLLYLDAHWGQRWPLHEELTAACRGVVVIDDFDIGHPRFGFDVYDDLVCGPDVLAGLSILPSEFWVNDPDAVFPLPCLQTGRRSGIGVLVNGLSPEPARTSPYLAARHCSVPARGAVNR